MQFAFNHYNFNITNLERSLAFYEKALGLTIQRQREAEDGSFIITYLEDHETGFRLELTWLRDWEKDHYDLGDNEMHLAMVTEDFEAARKLHEEMGCICFVNPKMGIYFIEDPDGYWIEILPKRR
ncbi:MAG: lactoylglutathione lyase [Ruminococcaceae bacterium]|jgi:lactoylglutathione lyase|nr:lactoylglutathione lyase [Oscillospiraceae bacterium]